MKHKKRRDPAASSGTRRRRAETAVVSIHKRPIVCPPDRAGRSLPFRLGGLFCRALVIWAASSGLIIFFSDAIQSGVSTWVILLTSLAVATLGMVFRHAGPGKLIASLASLGTLGALAAIRPQGIFDLPYSFVALYNVILTRLNKLGYWNYARFRVDITQWTDTTEDFLVTEAICILTVLVTLLFVACLSRKVHLVPPAILATSLLAVLLTFNIYSNSIPSNLGIVLIVVSFAAVLVMNTYDRLYRQVDSRRYDTELQLFDDANRPTMPPESAGRRAAAKARKGDDPQEAAAKARERRALARQVRAVKKYDRITAESRVAMGGYAAMAVLLACLLTISLPALVVKGNFNTIPAIDEKVDLARDYVTALLRGDDKALDRLDYQSDASNFRPHSTDAEQLEFTGRQIFYIQSRYNTNLYLRGWLGLDYQDGAWQAVNTDVLNAYHEVFGQDASPAEEMKYDFYAYMMPELVTTTAQTSDRAFPDYYTAHYTANTEYGFVGTLVSLRRVNSPSSLTYFPVSYDPNYGLFEFNSVTPNELSFVNYYDGLYTGRAFDKNKLEYATVAYAAVMTNRRWSENISHLQASYSLQKEALLVNTGISVNASGQINSRVTVEVELSDELVRLHYTHKSGSKTVPDTVWTTTHTRESYTYLRASDADYLTITTPDATLTLTLDGKKVLGAAILDVQSGTDLAQQYAESMTQEARSELIASLNRDRDYSDFVYDTYMDTSGSTDIFVLAQTIRRQAHTEELVDGVYVNTPADVSLASLRNASASEAYVQRDLLVRNVIDYIITELGCTYTITPNQDAADPTRDGVENFLFNTKEGYCVQFASAVALILRELGIPTRYAEGYIAADLNPKGDFVWGGYVRDENAHAWVEVWFDGIGWVSYETTPAYYAGMYGRTAAIDTSVTVPDGDTETEPVETQPETEPVESESETETETESESETEAVIPGTPAPTGGDSLRPVLIGLGALATLAGILLSLRALVTRARRAEREREAAVACAMTPAVSDSMTDSERRTVAMSLTEAVMQLLSYMKLPPLPGEFREAYAERLTLTLTAPARKKKPTPDIPPDASDSDRLATRRRAAKRKKGHPPADPPLPNLHVVLAGMAAEEFGHGMTDAELREVAAFYRYLHRQVKRRIPLGKRIRLRYFQRRI